MAVGESIPLPGDNDLRRLPRDRDVHRGGLSGTLGLVICRNMEGAYGAPLRRKSLIIIVYITPVGSANMFFSI